MISITLTSTTRTVCSLVPATVTQRSKTATDLGILAQAAGAAVCTAPVDRRRSNTTQQHLSAKHSNSQPIPRPTATSTTSHPTLVVDR
jgi:hypothetical protein